MKVLALVLFSFALATQTPPDVKVGPTVKVESTFDKTAKFGAFRTYNWGPGYDAQRADAHKIIISAIDAEMAKLGFKLVPSGGDVRLAYFAVTSTYVDVKALEKLQQEKRSAAAPTNTLGKLVVLMRSQTASTPLWQASTFEFVDPDIAKFPATMQNVAVRLFETYPTRKPAR